MSEDTIFHKIISREIPAEIVFEDEQILAFRDVRPVAPTHILLVPKTTLPSLKAAASEQKELLGHLMFTAAQIAKSEGIAEDGYRVVINTGPAGGQTVYQLHLHLLGGRELGWPPG